MTEVLERLKAEVARLKRELEEATRQLAFTIDWEAEAKRDGKVHIIASYQLAKNQLTCWGLECQLVVAIAALTAEQAKVEDEQLRATWRGNPTAVEVEEARKRFEAHLEKGKRTALEMVAQATDLNAARRRTQEKERREQELERQEELEQGQHMSM
jgi:hypothetical protein